MKTRLVWFLAISLAMANLTNAQGDDSWIGRRVITPYRTVLKVGSRVLDDEGRAANLASSGVDSSDFRVYRVEYVNGDWLWLKAEKIGVEGWVRASSVIPLDQAIDYYTNEIRADPSWSNYLFRGIMWNEKEEYDIAIADYDEAIRINPKSPVSFSCRAVAWRKKQQFDKAIVDCDEAIRINPKFAVAYYNRGSAWFGKSEYDKAIADYNEAIRINPKLAGVHEARGATWYQKKEYDKAIADYNEAIRNHPNTACCYDDRGTAWSRKKEYDKAIHDYTEAIRLDPKDARPYHNRGLARIERKEYDKAINDFNETIRLDHSSVDTYQQRGYAWYSLKEPVNALADYNEAVRLDPKSAWAYVARASLWATSADPKIRDGKKAVESAKKGCELNQWKDATDLGVLAAAYAESGDFDKAVEWEEQSIKLATDTEAKKKGEDVLKLYREKKPYRDEG